MTREGWLLHGVLGGPCKAPAGVPAHRQVAAQGHVGLMSRVTVPDAVPEPEQIAAAALEHHALLTGYAGAGDVLPLRFGTLVSGPEAAVAILTREAERHRALFSRIAGAQEYAVRVRAVGEPVAPAPSPADGRAFLRARQAATRGRATAALRQRQAVGRLATRLADLARDAVARQPGQGILLDLALLVARDGLAGFLAEARALHGQAAEDGLDLRISGPWPAYSFVAAPSAPSERAE